MVKRLIGGPQLQRLQFFSGWSQSSVSVLHRQHGQPHVISSCFIFHLMWRWLQDLSQCACLNGSLWCQFFIELLEESHCPCLVLPGTEVCSVGSISTLQPAPFPPLNSYLKDLESAEEESNTRSGRRLSGMGCKITCECSLCFSTVKSTG